MQGKQQTACRNKEALNKGNRMQFKFIKAQADAIIIWIDTKINVFMKKITKLIGR